jgi:uncharacterized protein (DUF427 family)
MAQASWNGVVIADSRDVVVVEGNVYFPASAVNQQYIRRSEHHTVCSWKGECSYYDVVVGDEVNRDAAWEYLDPKPAADSIRGRIAFWRGVKVVS